MIPSNSLNSTSTFKVSLDKLNKQTNKQTNKWIICNFSEMNSLLVCREYNRPFIYSNKQSHQVEFQVDIKKHMKMSTPTSFWFCCLYASKLNAGSPCQNVQAAGNIATFSQFLAAYSTLDFTRSPLAGKGTRCLLPTTSSMLPTTTEHFDTAGGKGLFSLWQEVHLHVYVIDNKVAIKL